MCNWEDQLIQPAEDSNPTPIYIEAYLAYRARRWEALGFKLVSES